MHAGAVVIPAAIALSSKLGGVDGKTFLLSIILGYDIAYRFARSMSPSIIKRGFHPSATCGAIGSAAVAAKLLRLNEEKTANALSLSAIQAGGLMEAAISGQSSKGIMVGRSAGIGIASAYLAQNDFPGPELAFEGESGFIQAVSAGTSLNEILKDLGMHFEIIDTYVKLYPACRHTHAAIEAITQLKEESDFVADDIEKIKIGTYPIAYDFTGHVHHPEDAQNACFSTTYCVATALLTNSFGVADLEPPSLKDIARRKLEEIIEVGIDEEAKVEFPKKRGTRATVTLKNGKVIEKFVYKLKGSPDIPIGLTELCEKFQKCSELCFTEEKIQKIISLINKLEVEIDVCRLISLLERDK
jgi:2-methylcitrate dehydratase PrpD